MNKEAARSGRTKGGSIMIATKARHAACMMGLVLAVARFGTVPAFAQSPKIGDPPEAKNMKLLGHDELQARSAYQPTIHHQGDRWIAYIGHHGGTTAIPKPINPMTGQAEFNGTSIVDVTDPGHPKYLVHIPGEEGLYEQGGAQMVRICDGTSLPHGDPKAVYMLRTFGNSAHEVWNVADPAHPVLVTRIATSKGTHKNWWECDTGIAYLVSGEEGWRINRMTHVMDLSDPAHPKPIRDFGLIGQEPGSTGPMPVWLHGPISLGPQSNRVYFGYGTSAGGVLQIVDRDKLLNGPKEPTPDNLVYPQVGRLDMIPWNGAHTVFPMLDMPVAEFAKDKVGSRRDFVMIVDEETANECQQARQMVWFADISVETKPMIVSSFTVPEASGNFCERGGRFGSHSSNESFAPIYYKKLAFIAWFNAGVRAIDVRDPYNPKEVGYFIPSITDKTDKRCIKVNNEDRCKVAIQTNNVETDERGYIYIVDRANTGLHILELTGEPRQTVSLH